MGRQSNTLTPYASGWHFLGAELRVWRTLRGLSTAELARRVNVSAALVQKVERANRTAQAELLDVCDRVLETGGALGRLYVFVAHAEAAAADARRTATAVAAFTVAVTDSGLRFAVEPEPSPPPVAPAEAAGEARPQRARVYSLADARQSRQGQTV